MSIFRTSQAGDDRRRRKGSSVETRPRTDEGHPREGLRLGFWLALSFLFVHLLISYFWLLCLSRLVTQISSSCKYALILMSSYKNDHHHNRFRICALCGWPGQKQGGKKTFLFCLGPIQYGEQWKRGWGLGKGREGKGRGGEGRLYTDWGDWGMGPLLMTRPPATTRFGSRGTADHWQSRRRQRWHLKTDKNHNKKCWTYQNQIGKYIFSLILPVWYIENAYPKHGTTDFVLRFCTRKGRIFCFIQDLTPWYCRERCVTIRN